MTFAAARAPNRHRPMIDQYGIVGVEAPVGTAIDDRLIIAYDDIGIAARRVSVPGFYLLRRIHAESIAIRYNDLVRACSRLDLAEQKIVRPAAPGE